MSRIDQWVTVLDAQDAPRQVKLSDLLFLRGPEMHELLYDMGYNMPFRDPVYEDILVRMLGRIPADMDTRQGSVIYDTLAAAAVELTQLYLEREANRALMFVSTTVGEALDRKVFEQGIVRASATAAVRRGYFWADEAKKHPFGGVSIGGVYSLDELNFTVLEPDAEDEGVYLLKCDVPGAVGNRVGGEMVPVEYLQGLAVAELGEAVTPGEDAEGDEALYARWVETVLRPPFGGNRSDYEDKLRLIGGVGPVRLLRAVPEPGHVTVKLLGADGLPPDPALIADVQEALDPSELSGEGLGTAPMCHIVHVEGAQAQEIAFEATLTLADGLSLGQIRPEVEEALARVLAELREAWGVFGRESAQYPATVVRIALMEAAVLSVEGVEDIAGAQINGTAGNLLLEDDSVPVPGEVMLHA